MKNCEYVCHSQIFIKIYFANSKVLLNKVLSIVFDNNNFVCDTNEDPLFIILYSVPLA